MVDIRHGGQGAALLSLILQGVDPREAGLAYAKSVPAYDERPGIDMKRIRGRSVTRNLIRDAALRIEGSYDLEIDWIQQVDACVVAEETAGRVDPDQAIRLEKACRQAGISRLIGMANDPPFVALGEAIYSVRPTTVSLGKFDLEMAGVNAVLFDPMSSVTLLATVDDYSLLAGPREFVLTYQPAEDEALERFREFAKGQVSELRPAALRALSMFQRFRPASG